MIFSFLHAVEDKEISLCRAIMLDQGRTVFGRTLGLIKCSAAFLFSQEETESPNHPRSRAPMHCHSVIARLRTRTHTHTAAALTQDTYNLLGTTEQITRSQITLFYQEIVDIAKEKT